MVNPVLVRLKRPSDGCRSFSPNPLAAASGSGDNYRIRVNLLPSSRKMNHLTSLRPKVKLERFDFSPCVLPGAEFEPKAEVILIDHETDDEALREGDPEAIANAKRILAGVRAAARPNASVGWYGWPFPLNENDVEPLARVFGPLLERADFLAPCCYVANAEDERTELRGYLFDECVARMSPRVTWEMERYGVVSEWTLDSQTRCDDRMIGDQIRACDRADCDAMYLWSGMDYRVNVAKKSAPFGHPLYQVVNECRAELLGNYGFRVYSWKPREVDREHALHAKRLAKRFADAWDAIAV